MKLIKKQRVKNWPAYLNKHSTTLAKRKKNQTSSNQVATTKI